MTPLENTSEKNLISKRLEAKKKPTKRLGSIGTFLVDRLDCVRDCIIQSQKSARTLALLLEKNKGLIGDSQ